MDKGSNLQSIKNFRGMETTSVPLLADVDECASSPCQNGGTCQQPEPAVFSCSCLEGFLGDRCQQEKLCHNKCKNGGTCQELSGVDYICMCPLGFTARNCEVNIDECSSNPCRQLGVCIDGVNSYTCACMKGTSGSLCEVNLDNCNPNPCMGNVRCVDWTDDFYCMCPNGTAGKICNVSSPDTLYIPCTNNPCLNGGACWRNRDGTTRCDCAKGFTGTQCEKNIDDCKLGLCKAGARCTDWIDDFYCHCPPKTYGKTCGDNTTVTTFTTQEPQVALLPGGYGIDATFLAVLLGILIGLGIIILIASAVRFWFRRGQPRDFCFALRGHFYRPFYDWNETTFTSERY